MKRRPVFKIVSHFLNSLEKNKGFVFRRRFPRQIVCLLLDEFGSKPLRGVEVGVWEGKTTHQFLRMLNFDVLYLVDPYIPYNEPDKNAFLEEAKTLSKHRTEDFICCEWIHKRSDEASGIIPDGLDFVFVDGDHSYEAVLSDLRNYYPKLRVGGFLLGDDFACVGVARAVVDFCNEKGLEFEVLTNGGLSPEFVIRKEAID